MIIPKGGKILELRRTRVPTKCLVGRFALFASLLLPLSLPAQDKIAVTPPMGWNSWNHFAE